VRTHKKAAAAITATLLAAAGLVATAPRAVAQPPGQSTLPAGVLAFTPAGLGTSYAVPNPDGANVAVVAVGILNDSDQDVTVDPGEFSFQPTTAGDAVLGGYESTVAPGATWVAPVALVGPGEATVTALVGGRTVTSTIDAEALSGPAVCDIHCGNVLTGLGNTIPTEEADDAEPPLVGPSPLATVPFDDGPGLAPVVDIPPFNDARDLVSLSPNVSGLSATPGKVDVALSLPPATSLTGWAPDQTQVIDAAWTGALGRPGTPWTKVVVADPFLVTTAPAIPAELAVHAKRGASTPVAFDTAPDADVSASSVVLAGPAAADFSVTLNEAAKASPANGGTWDPVDVTLTAKKPGTYKAEVVVRFDPAGSVFYATIPITTMPPASTPTPVPFTPPPPDPVAVGQTCGAGGTQVDIWGQNLAGSTVRFAGTPSAPVQVLGPGEVQATVPYGVRRNGRIVVVGAGGQAVPGPGWVRWQTACPTALSVGLRRVGGLVEATATLDEGNTPVVGGRVVLLHDGRQVASLLTGPHGHAWAVFLPDNTPTEAVFDGSAHLVASEWRAGR